LRPRWYRGGYEKGQEQAANKTGVAKDKVEVVVVEAKEVGPTNQELGASNVVSTIILPKSATHELNVIIV